MSIQRDITDILAEVGVSFTTERLGVATGNATEYFTYTPNRQVTKPFVREHFLEIVLTSDTNVQTGDILNTVTSSESFMCVNNTPDLFENEIIRYLAVLYKTNVLVDLLRPQNTTVGYDTSLDFAERYSAQKALIYAPVFGNKGEVDDDIGFVNAEKEELYIPDGYGVVVGDRIRIHGGTEQYLVSAVIPRRYPTISVLELSEDTRE